MKKNKDKKKDEIIVKLEEGEEIVFMTKTSRTIMRAFWIISPILLALGAYLIIHGTIFLTGNDQVDGIIGKIIGAWGMNVVGVAIALIIIILFIYLRGWLKRTYYLTNKSVIVVKSGFASFTRRIDRKDVQGFSVEQGFVARGLALRSVEFYSPSFQVSSKKFLGLIPLQSSPFRFKYIPIKDAEKLEDLVLGLSEKEEVKE